MQSISCAHDTISIDSSSIADSATIFCPELSMLFHDSFNSILMLLMIFLSSRFVLCLLSALSAIMKQSTSGSLMFIRGCSMSPLFLFLMQHLMNYPVNCLLILVPLFNVNSLNYLKLLKISGLDYLIENSNFPISGLSSV